MNAVGCEARCLCFDAGLSQQAKILIPGKTEGIYPQGHGGLGIVGVENVLPVFRPVVAELFHHPHRVAEPAGIVCRFLCAFPLRGPEDTIHQPGQMGFVQGATGFNGFIENGVIGLLAEAQLEQGNQHQVMDDAVGLAQRFFQPAVELAVEAVKPAAGAVTERLENRAFIGGQAVQCGRQALGQGLAILHGKHHTRGDGAHGVLSVAHLSAAPGRA